MSRNIAKVPVTWDLLRDCLHLPRDTDLADVQFDFGRDVVTLTVSHPDLKPVGEGCVPPNVAPKILHQQAIVFEGWGQD